MFKTIENPFPKETRGIGIVAPASMPKAAEIDDALKLLKSWGIDARTGGSLLAGGDAEYLSAPDEARLADLNGMIRDESVDLVLCARGGYGSMRILNGVDWETLKRRKLPILGYSDITALHLSMLAKGAGIPFVCTMASKLKKLDAFSAEAMKNALKRREGAFVAVPLPKGRKLESLKNGSAQGPLIPANLTLLAALQGSEFSPDFAGTLLLIEDVGEKPRVVDRTLAQLELSGVLGKIAGLILGDFSDCGSSQELKRVFARYAPCVKGPVIAGLPFGHELPTLAFRMGEEALLKNGELFLKS